MVERCGYRRETEISHFASSNSNSNYSSFSSSLLDAIYRSIDQGEEEMVIYGEGMGKKSCEGASVRRGVFGSDEEMANFQRACMIEKWMEKKVSEKAVGRRNSVADFQVKKPRKDRVSSSWSSSDSSAAAGFFSSSEAESFQSQRPKPIRTGFEKEEVGGNRSGSEQKAKIEGGFSKTKLRALKIYGDLKKVKQPISPGGKLAGFLNSLFAGGNMKKSKIGGDVSPSLKSTNASTCSSASSFSRSCLSKTPSSRGNHSAGAKRSVRFSPVSVIVDDDRRHKSQHSEINNNKQTSSNRDAAAKNHNNMNSIRSAINEELMAHVMDQNRRVEEVARDLLRNYQRKNQKPHVKHEVFDRDFDEDDDAASYASSDLFELDNLSAIGMERYGEELPVYETTRFDSSGNGLIY
ncbi:protein BIG GRAIN 1-like A [Salvia divinorum]|uniref:Protein BIG GRAIN 1-like A n=1 Tax=Salvia divinorum TaxID=28513 RepID=A0ABD1H5M4_SALDI